jgi:hypothetical protein
MRLRCSWRLPRPGERSASYAIQLEPVVPYREGSDPGLQVVDRHRPGSYAIGPALRETGAATSGIDSTKIRTTVITLIAACSVAFASVAFTPVASSAPNNHRYAKTVGKRLSHNTCANAQISFDNAITLAEYDAKQSDIRNADKDLNLATIHDNANASGCSVS